MIFWQTQVEGETLREVKEAAEKAILSFFGSAIVKYDLRVYPMGQIRSAGGTEDWFYKATVEVEL